MLTSDSELWRGLRASARDALEQRDYGVPAVAAGNVVGKEDIPGVVVFPRRVYPQKNRGFLSELARIDDEPLAGLELRPVQWASACMFGGTWPWRGGRRRRS